MTRGGYDYRTSNSVYGQSITDVAELAARIHSPDLLERKGQVVYTDDFYDLDGGWYKRVVMTNTIDFYSYPAYHSCVSVGVKINNYTADDDYLYKSFPLIDPNKLGIELMFYHVWAGASKYVTPEIKLLKIKDGYSHLFALKIDAATRTLVVRGSPAGGAGWTTISSELWATHDNAYGQNWHYFKLVIDYNNDHYDHVIVDNLYINCKTTWPVYTAVYASDQNVLYLGGYEAVDKGELYFTNLVMTINEP